MLPSVRFLKKHKFYQNLENYLQLTSTKEFKHQMGNLAISTSNPETSCAMKPSEKQKGILKLLFVL